MTIDRKEFNNCHYYFIDGEFYPGVTSILDEAAPTGFGLKQFFLNHTAEDAEDIRVEAAGFGSRMHDLYERLLHGEKLDLTGEPLKAVKHLLSFKDWYKDFSPKDHKTELMVFSKTYHFAGTLDLVATSKKEVWLVDFKTSSGIHFNHEIQLVAYKQAYEEMTGIKVDRMGILRTGTKHRCGFEFKEIARPFEDFLNVYRTYLALHGGRLPELPVELLKKYPTSLQL